LPAFHDGMSVAAGPILERMKTGSIAGSQTSRHSPSTLPTIRSLSNCETLCSRWYAFHFGSPFFGFGFFSISDSSSLCTARP